MDGLCQFDKIIIRTKCFFGLLVNRQGQIFILQFRYHGPCKLYQIIAGFQLFLCTLIKLSGIVRIPHIRYGKLCQFNQFKPRVKGIFSLLNN